MYDESGRLILDTTDATVPTESTWNVWFYHNLDKTRDMPGRWRFVLSVNERQLAQQSFEVVNSQLSKAELSNH